MPPHHRHLSGSGLSGAGPSRESSGVNYPDPLHRSGRRGGGGAGKISAGTFEATDAGPVYAFDELDLSWTVASPALVRYAANTSASSANSLTRD